MLPILKSGSNAKLCFSETYCPHHVVTSLFMCVCMFALIRWAGVGTTDSHEPRGFGLPFQRRLFFSKVYTHTLASALPHAASSAYRRATWAAEAGANRWEEQTSAK